MFNLKYGRTVNHHKKVLLVCRFGENTHGGHEFRNLEGLDSKVRSNGIVLDILSLRVYLCETTV